MTPAQAWLATTLPDNTTELPQTADTQPEQSTLLPEVISTDTTDKSSQVTSTKFAIQHQKETVLTTEGHLPFGRPPTFHGNTFDDATHVPRCKKGYRLLAGTCIKLGPTGWIGKSHYDAKKVCKKEGATLAMPKTEELDVALRDLVKREGDNYQHWIGMEEKKGTWYWVDGLKVGNNGYQGWTPGQPSNPRWPPLCGQYWAKPLKSSGWLFSRSGYPMWDDDACLNLRRFICQRPPA
ncbi:C-type lectin lectoxin-Enh4-like [Branchiostoma floridae x Branchiostoma belcheri]